MNNNIAKFLGKKVRPIELASFLKKIMGIKRFVYRLDDNFFYLDPVSNFGIRIMNEGEYESDFTSVIQDVLKEGDTFIDVGANEGYFTVLASHLVGKKGRVLALEPQARLHPVILQNIKLNRITNACLLPYAVGESDSSSEIILSPSINTGSSTFIQNKRNKLWKKETITIVKLDDLFDNRGLNDIKLIKFDIEGFEIYAIKGMIDSLSKKRIKNVLIEMHPTQLMQMGHEVREIVDILNQYGYKASTKHADLFVLKD